MNINGVLVIGYNTPVTGEYTTNTNKPPESIEDIDFMIYEAGGGLRYSPKTKVDYNKYEDIIEYMEGIYGSPLKQKGTKYQWCTEDDSLKINMVYDTDIYNSMAIGINTN
jgi:hypothetical protein